MIRRRATRISKAQIASLVLYFKQPPPAIAWDKAKKKSEVSKLLLDPRYTSLNRGQINNQLNGHILSAQLTMMVGAQMTVATDQMMDVQNGDTPNPLTAANVPFAQQHTLLILSELHETYFYYIKKQLFFHAERKKIHRIDHFDFLQHPTCPLCRYSK